MRRLTLRAVVFLISAAGSAAGCASPAPQPAAAVEPAFDPVGTYDFTTLVQGSPVSGRLSFGREADGRLTASIVTEITGPLPVQNVTVEGRQAHLRAATPDGDVTMRVDFDGPRITGAWELSTGLSGTLTGQRRDGAGRP